MTLQNSEEIARVHKLNTFNGDVFKFEKFNDLSDYDDLFNKTNNNLKINSQPRKELRVITTRPFLELGDTLDLNFNDFKFDGRYICYGFNAKYFANTHGLHITYLLRNSFNSDTLLNIYDNQTYRTNPLLVRAKGTTLYKYKDYASEGNLHYLYGYNKQTKTKANNLSTWKFK
ncbi:hypothetical protein [Mycoplasmopsis californica]|uniref:hypothetical protein n=1 Tax=Mycoplasmopsis californica TaxID=2113 RepID=UPI00069050D2|nr:hypothetical protein [Mycoplasmopsis californica]